MDFPTGKIIEIQGVKLVGFGEQTTRKALGTLQVLIEKEIRRQKDPKSLLIALEVQRAALKRSKKLTLFKRRKLKTLDDTIRLLKSKAFSKLLEKKVPGLTKEFPLVAKINSGKLKKINFGKVREDTLKKVKARPLFRNNEKKISVISKRIKILKRKKIKTSKNKNKITKLQTQIKELRGFKLPVSRVVKKKVSRPRFKKKRPSRLPKSKKKGSVLPSNLKRSKPSKLVSSRPSRLKGSKLKPSKLVSSRPSRLKGSKLKPSKLAKSQVSKLKPSQIRPSKLPPSRLSKLPASRIRSALVRLPKGAPRPPPRILRRPKNRKEEQRVIQWLKQQKVVFRPSLVAVLFNITGIPKKRLTGFEIRPIPVFRKVKKRPKRLKRRAARKKSRR